MRCDCGYDFSAKEVKESYLTPKQRRQRDQATEGEHPEHFEHRILTGGVVAGGLAMIGAVVWFFFGLKTGWIFFYPPVLFLFGLFAVIRGLDRSP